MTKRPLLSAAIIVRDEAEFLHACLSSIKGVCDQIVVVDTGSTDDTVDVARGFGADIGFHEWNKDFAAARNASLEMATGEWILYIDADELLVELDVDSARAELRDRRDAVALRVRFQVRPGFTPYREFRVWRHHPDIRFVSQIHETVVPGIVDFGRTHGLLIADSDRFSIVHHGYEGDQTHKHRRNLPMLEAWLKDHPNRCYLWNHLGQVRMGLGDSEGAIDAWTTGLALIRERGMMEPSDILIYVSLVQEYVEQGIDVSDLVREMRELVPNYRLTDWLEARNLQNCGLHREAVAVLDRLVTVDALADEGAQGCDERVFGEFPWAAKGTSFFALGEMRAALDAFEQALAFDPSNIEYRTKVIALKSITRS